MYIGNVMPVSDNRWDTIVPSPIAIINWNTADGYMLVWRSCFFSSSTRRLSSSGTTVSNRFFFSIRRLPTGPPMILPIIRPNVAPAVQSVVAPIIPKSSSTGPNAPAVPWPPTIGIEPVHSPTSGLMCKSFASPTAKKFCERIRPMTSPRKIISAFPPLFNTFKFAWKPTEVKKNTMHTSFKISSNENSAIPVT